MAHRRWLALVLLILTAQPSSSGAAPTPPCPGDCNSDGQVTISELVLMVNAALGTAAARCGDGTETVAVADVVAAVGFALDGCPAPPADATATPSPIPTPTSCRAVIPLVAPVTSPTDALEQTTTLCGIGYASSCVDACGPAGCVEEFTTLFENCPLQCPDSRQACVSGTIPLLPNQLNPIQVCQVPGVGCGPLPDLCAEEDVNGAPLTIEQRGGTDAQCPCLQNGGQPGPGECPCDVGQCYAACVADLCPGTPQCTLECSFRCSCNSAPPGCPTHEDPGPTPTAVSE